MKNIIYIILAIVIASPMYSQIWEQVSTPHRYMYVSMIGSINDDIYISRIDPIAGRSFNYQYEDGKWPRAEDDTLYEYFKVHMIAQENQNVIVYGREGYIWSTDSARSWVKISQEVGVGKPLDLEVTENTCYAIPAITFINGLYKLNLESNSWEVLQDKKQDTTLKLYVHEVESNSTHLFALQKQQHHPRVTTDTLEGGLYISTNWGESWEKTLRDSSFYSVYSDDDLLLVSTTNGNLLRSEDNGVSWETISLGTSIRHYSKDNNRILAGTTSKGIVSLNDNAKSWEVLTQELAVSNVYKKGYKYFFLGFGNLLYESDSAFTNVKRANLIHQKSDIHRIYPHNDTLLATGPNERGITYSTDNGESWHTYSQQLENSLENVDYLAIKDNQFYCTAPYAVYSSFDYGKTYDYTPVWGEFYGLLILDDNKILLNEKYLRYISRDSAKTFTMMDTTVIKNSYMPRTIVKAMNGDLLAFTIYNGVYKSTDNAETWNKFIDSLPVDTTFSSIKQFYEFGEDYYIVNMYPPGILKSTNKGVSWEKLDIDLFDKIQDLTITMIDENNILISSYGTGIKGLKVSNDQGKSWKDIQTDEGLDNNEYYPILGAFGEYAFIRDPYKPFKGNGSLYRAKLEDLGITTSVESETERNYLYTFPPYPNPADSEINVLTYWDINLPMSEGDVSVYDLNGRKVNTEGKIKIVKQADHYGRVTWDCSGEQAGVYIININHGTEEKAVKVVVE